MVYNGQRSDRNGVVGLIINTADRSATCSGSLIMPDLILTARHCVAMVPDDFGCEEGATLGPLVDAPAIHVTGAGSLTDPGAHWSRGTDVRVPPGALCGADVAIVAIDWPVDGAPLQPATAAPQPGDAFTFHGYGRTSWEGTDGGARRALSDVLVLCDGEACAHPVASTEWRAVEGSCPGDSGGPALDMRGDVIGVSSRSRNDCQESVFGSTGAHLEWIAAVTREHAEATGAEVPSWAGEGGEPGMGWTSCSAAPAGSAGHGGAAVGLVLVLVLVLVLAVLRRAHLAAACIALLGCVEPREEPEPEPAQPTTASGEEPDPVDAPEPAPESCPDAGHGGEGGQTGALPCEHAWTYAADGTETSVEVRAAWGPWSLTLPMVNAAGQWTASAEIPADGTVLYSLVINGHVWIPDPTNPDMQPDGAGGWRSVLRVVGCEVRP